jgi:hypothetical protein
LSNLLSKFLRQPIEDCDVKDRMKLATYRAMATSWIELLHDDSEHSIVSQYHNMMWQDAAWRMANEARRYTFDDGPSSAITPVLGQLIDHGYAMGQVIAISRLLEKSNPKRPKKAVVSIRRIVDELYENRCLFTREIFVTRHGCGYDWFPGSGSTSSTELRWVEPTGANGWLQSCIMHDLFDKLSGTDSQKRHRDDRLPDSIFETLTKKLDDPVFNEIAKLRNKRVAHAADAYSRNQVDNLRKSLKFEELEKAHYILTGVIQTVSSVFLTGLHIGTSVLRAQPEAFEHIDKPFIQSARKREFWKFWCAHTREREKWLNDARNDTLPELT